MQVGISSNNTHRLSGGFQKDEGTDILMLVNLILSEFKVGQ